MSRVQTRRTVSLTVECYDAIERYADAHGYSCSSVLEWIIGDEPPTTAEIAESRRRADAARAAGHRVRAARVAESDSGRLRRIESALRSTPSASDRDIAARSGAGIATVARHRARLGIPPNPPTRKRSP